MSETRMVRYLLINLDRSPDRLKKYEVDIESGKIIRIPAINFTDASIDQHLERQINLANIKPQNKRKNIACTLSHIKALNYIVSEMLDDVVILEDDVAVDFERMERISPSLSQNHVTQVGGHIWPPVFSMKGWKKPTFEDGVHEINTQMYHIMGSHGYYLPRWQVAKQFVDWITSRERWRNYDNLIEKSPQKRYFVYPAIVTLHTGDANASTMGHTTKFNDCKYY